MVSPGNTNLLDVDWSKIPEPKDDGAASHLPGQAMPAINLSATTGGRVDLSAIEGRWVLFAYPRTNRPGEPSLVEDWDLIPGARGCTPQSCSFRDLASDLERAGARKVFAVSTQSTDYQQEAAERLHLPFAILSDTDLDLARALSLPTFDVGGNTLLRRLSMVITDGRISAVQYPVFPPDQNAERVLAWLRENPVANVR